MNLTIDREILEILPSFDVIAYTLDLENQNTKKVTAYLEHVSQKYNQFYPLTEIVNLPKLKESRDGYKKLGKDPSHTRVAAEALLRRVVKGMGIYRLGDAIDIGNILSLETKRSVCVVDLDKIQGDVRIRIGKEKEYFEAIHRGPLHLVHLPVYEDELGPFGTPSSDTERTMVDEKTKRILVMIICFTDNEKEKDEKLLLELYQEVGNARNVKKIEVQYGKF